MYFCFVLSSTLECSSFSSSFRPFCHSASMVWIFVPVNHRGTQSCAGFTRWNEREPFERIRKWQTFLMNYRNVGCRMILCCSFYKNRDPRSSPLISSCTRTRLFYSKTQRCSNFFIQIVRAIFKQKSSILISIPNKSDGQNILAKFLNIRLSYLVHSITAQLTRWTINQR